MRTPKAESQPDFLFLSALILIVIFGLVMLTSASSDIAKARFGNSFYHLKHQILNGLLVGIFGFLTGVFVYYHKWEKIALLLIGINLLLLLFVFTPFGLQIKGATRWLSIGNFSFQPSEILKLTFIFYFASWLNRNQKKRSRSWTQGFLPFLFLLSATAFLLIQQPATTTAIIIFTAGILTYFAGGARLSFLGAVFLIGLLLLSLVIYFTPYRRARILAYLNPEKADVLKEGYHRNQTLIAIGSGKIFGVGYGKSTTKLNYLPEPIGDSIFAVIAEELGFVGSSVFIILFLVLIFRGLMIAKKAPDILGRLLVVGFISIIGIQAFIHIGAVAGILPLTGIALPFVSYGGTALAASLTMCGVIINVSRYKR